MQELGRGELGPAPRALLSPAPQRLQREMAPALCSQHSSLLIGDDSELLDSAFHAFRGATFDVVQMNGFWTCSAASVTGALRGVETLACRALQSLLAVGASGLHWGGPGTLFLTESWRWWCQGEQHRFGCLRDTNQLQSAELGPARGMGLVLTWSPATCSEMLAAQNS